MSEWPVLIRSYRRDNGLKQDALAGMLNVDQTTISRWERGIDTPSLAMQKRLRDLFWKREDSALDAAVRMVRAAPGRAAILVPGTRIIAVSEAYARRYETSASEMRGQLMRHYYGDEYYEQYMLPLAAKGIYSGEIARMDVVARVMLPDGSPGFSQSTILPVISASGIHAVSWSEYIPAAIADTRPSCTIVRFDEMTGME